MQPESALAPAPGLARQPARVRAKPKRRFEAVGERLEFVRDPLRIAMFVLTVLTISRVHEHYPILAKFRPALLLVVASVGYAYLNPRYLATGNVLRLWPMRNVAILGVLACCSAAFGISLGRSASFILDTYAKTLAYGFLLAVSIRHVRDLYTFVWAYVVSCGILAYFSLFIFGISKGGGSYVTRLNNLHTYDSNDLTVVIMPGLAMTLLLLGIERGRKRWFLFLVIVSIGATIARSGSRGGFLGFIAAGAAALLFVNSVSVGRRLAMAAVISIALVLGAPPGYWLQMRTIVKPEDDYNYSSVDGRKALILRGLGYVRQYPLFGLGIDNFSRAECTISPKIENRMNGPMRCTPPHNSFLQAGTELGIPGFLVWVSLAVGGIFASLRLRGRLPKSWRRGTQSEQFLYGATSFFAVALVGFSVTAFFVQFAWVDPIYVMAALLTGLHVSVRGHISESGRSRSASGSQTATDDPGNGWRVTRSARRSEMIGQLRPKTR